MMWVEAHNADVDIANYDATKDRLYGDTLSYQKGNTKAFLAAYFAAR